MTEPHAALIDLDGTLIDSVPDLVGALADLLVEMGRQPPPFDRMKTFIGDGVAMLVRRGFAATGGPDADPSAAQVARFMQIYDDRHHRDSKVYPGAIAVLQALAAAGWRLAVVTNKPERAARDLLAHCGLLRFFPEVLGGDTLPTRKPNPEMLLAALDRLGVAPHRAVMIGDGPQDGKAAAAAGVAGIHVTWGYGDGDEVRKAAVGIVRDWNAVPDLVNRLIRA